MAETLGSAVLELDTDQSGLESGLGKAESTSRSKLSKIGGIAKGAAKVTAGAMTATAGAAVAATFKVADYGDAVAVAAEKASVGVEEYQELSFAFEQAGLDSEVFGAALRRMNRRLGLAADGTGAAKDTFGELGVAIRDSNGQVRETGDVLDDVLPKLAGIESDSLRAAKASEIFGEDAGPALAGALSEGMAGIDAARQKAQDLGIVMDEDAVEGARAFSDSWMEIKETVLGTMRTALTPLMGWMTDSLFPTIMDTVIPAFRSFWATVQEGESFLGGLMDAIKELVGGGEAVEDVSLFDFILGAAKNVFNQLLDWLTGPGVESILTTLVEARTRMLEAGMQLIMSLLEAAQEFLPGFIEFLGSTLIPNILEFLIGAVPKLLETAVMVFETLAQAITTVLPVLIETLATDVLPAIITSLTEMIPSLLQAGIEAFLAIVQAVLKVLPTLLETILGVLLPEVLIAIAEMLPEILPVAIDTFLALVDAIIEVLPILIDVILTKVLPALVVALIKMAPELGQAMADASMQLAVGLLEAIPSLLKGVWQIGMAISEAILGLRDRIWEAGKNLMSSLGDGIRDAVGEVTGAVGDVIDKAREYLPFSPAKQGPLSGRGAPRVAGAKIAEDLAAGIQDRMPEVRTAAELMVQPVATGARGENDQEQERALENTEINVYNPEPEPASQSISRVLREESALRGVG